MTRKLCEFILLDFGLATFRLHFGKTWKPFMFRPGRSDHDSQSQLYLTSGPPNYAKYFEKNPKQIPRIWLIKISEIVNRKFRNVRKDVRRTILLIRGMRSSEYCIWNQYLSKNIESKLANSQVKEIHQFEWKRMDAWADEMKWHEMNDMKRNAMTWDETMNERMTDRTDLKDVWWMSERIDWMKWM